MAALCICTLAHPIAKLCTSEPKGIGKHLRSHIPAIAPVLARALAVLITPNLCLAHVVARLHRLPCGFKLCRMLIAPCKRLFGSILARENLERAIFRISLAVDLVARLGRSANLKVSRRKATFLWSSGAKHFLDLLHFIGANLADTLKPARLAINGHGRKCHRRFAAVFLVADGIGIFLYPLHPAPRITGQLRQQANLGEEWVKRMKAFLLGELLNALKAVLAQILNQRAVCLDLLHPCAHPARHARLGRNLLAGCKDQRGSGVVLDGLMGIGRPDFGQWKTGNLFVAHLLLQGWRHVFAGAFQFLAEVFDGRRICSPLLCLLAVVCAGLLLVCLLLARLPFVHCAQCTGNRTFAISSVWVRKKLAGYVSFKHVLPRLADTRLAAVTPHVAIDRAADVVQRALDVDGA